MLRSKVNATLTFGTIQISVFIFYKEKKKKYLKKETWICAYALQSELLVNTKEHAQRSVTESFTSQTFVFSKEVRCLKMD